jgi:hypothetical protein
VNVSRIIVSPKHITHTIQNTGLANSGARSGQSPSALPASPPPPNTLSGLPGGSSAPTSRGLSRSVSQQTIATHNQGESRATVVIRDNFTTSAQVAMVGNTIVVKSEHWNVDGAMFRTLARHLFGPMRVATWEMIREGNGEDAKWKFNLPVTDPLWQSVDVLKSQGRTTSAPSTR